MKKVKLQVEETLKYEREVILLVPDDTDDIKMQELVEYAQRAGDIASDIGYVLKRKGVAEDSSPDISLGDPDSAEMEIEYWSWVTEEDEDSDPVEV